MVAPDSYQLLLAHYSRGCDASGRAVASGVYTARFTSPAGDASVSMILLR